MTYPFSKHLFSADLAHECWHDLILDALLRLDVNGVALLGPSHDALLLIVLKGLVIHIPKAIFK